MVLVLTLQQGARPAEIRAGIMEYLTSKQLADEFIVCKRAFLAWLKYNGLSHLARPLPMGKGKRFVFSEEAAGVIRNARAAMFAYESVEIGDRFGRLVVTGKGEIRKYGRCQSWVFPCLCLCGNCTTVQHSSLASGRTQSCGCQAREQTRARIKHGGARRGQYRLYGIWQGMKRRCYDAASESFGAYGAQGISVCPEWHDFTVFREWAMANGYGDTLTIDRKDGELGYWPENCRWATIIQQQNNRRSNVIIDAWGEEKTIKEWSRDRRCAVCYATLKNRLQRQFWEPERAITEPARLIKW